MKAGKITQMANNDDDKTEECPSCNWADKTWCDRATYSEDFDYWFEDWYCEHCHNHWTIIEDKGTGETE